MDNEREALVGNTTPLVRGWLDLGAHVAQKTIITSFAIVREVHREWKLRFRETLDLAENTQHGVMQLVRRVADHLDALAEESYGAAEEGLTGRRGR